MDTTATAAVVSAFRSLGKERPDYVLLALEGDETARVAVPNVKRWKPRLAKLLGSYPWRHVTPVNAKGDVVGPRVDNPDTFEEDEQAGELEDLELAPSAHASFAGLLQLMLKAQDTALVRQKQAYDSVLTNNQKLLEVIASRLENLEKQRMNDISSIASLHRQLVESSAGEGDSDAEVMSLVQAALQAQAAKGAQQ